MAGGADTLRVRSSRSAAFRRDPERRSVTPRSAEVISMDFVAVLFGIAIFALLILYVPACEKV